MRRTFVNQHPREGARATAIRFGKELRAARIQNGDSQEAAAAAVGTWQAEIVKIEKGYDTKLSLATVLRLIDRYGMTLSLAPRRDEDIQVFRDEKKAAAERRRAQQIPLLADAKAEFDRAMAADRARRVG